MDTASTQFDIQLTDKDVFVFQSQLLWRQSKAVIIAFAVSYLFLLLVLLFSYVAAGKVYLVTTIIAFTLPIFLHMLRKRIAKKTLAESRSLIEKQHYAIDNEKVVIKGESFETEYLLKNLKQATITKDHVLLWQSKNSANVIPKRCLDGEQLAQLKKIIEPYRTKKD